MGRPAHRLTVSKDAISSFEIDDPNYPHPRVGICRRCWRTWHDQAEFDQHAANPCNKVSKGKREKWQILYEGFTPLVDTSMSQAAPQQPLQIIGTQLEELGRSPSRQSGFFMASLWDDHVSTPSSVLSQADMYPQPSAPAVPVPGQAPIPAEYYVRLEKEVAQLRQLVAATAQDRHMHGGPSHNPRGSHFAGGPGMSLHLGPLSTDRIVASSSRPAAPGSNRQGQSPERDNLILHMGSQPHRDVDVHGLMNEPKENLSRHNSGLSSSSKSTIHHVSNSPPQRLDEYPDAREATNAQATKATPNRKPPTSIPDSGYASAGNRNRHGSLGDITHMPTRGHHRNSSSLSTLAPAPQPHPAASSLWSPEMFGVLGMGRHQPQQPNMSSLLAMPPQHPQQQQQHDQVINTLNQMLEHQQPAPQHQQQGHQSQQQQCDASFDDQFFNHQAYYDGM